MLGPSSKLKKILSDSALGGSWVKGIVLSETVSLFFKTILIIRSRNLNISSECLEVECSEERVKSKLVRIGKKD